MSWFEALTGFREPDYEATRSRLLLEGGRLRSLVNGRSWAIGTLDTPSLALLRDWTPAPPARRTRVRCMVADVRRLHLAPEQAGALFQVASQFNLLEMAAPDLSPEHGVTRYEADRTQGPACAIACGAATIYRNFFVPVDGQPGQTRTRQLDMLTDLGRALGEALDRPVSDLWEMRNGYALARAEGLAAANALLASWDEAARDALRARLRIGLHAQVECTEATRVPRPSDPVRPGGGGPIVSQAFCSAMPVAYTRLPASAWAPLAPLVLEAAYEATLRAALLQVLQGGSPQVLLTRLGGGVFGNPDAWIDAAMHRALTLARDWGLDVRLVCHGSLHPSMQALKQAFDPD